MIIQVSANRCLKVGDLIPYKADAFGRPRQLRVLRLLGGVPWIDAELVAVL